MIEINKFAHLCKGHEPNVKMLNAKVQQLMTHYERTEGRDMLPFVLGRDYFPKIRATD